MWIIEYLPKTSVDRSEKSYLFNRRNGWNPINNFLRGVWHRFPLRVYWVLSGLSVQGHGRRHEDRPTLPRGPGEISRELFQKRQISDELAVEWYSLPVESHENAQTRTGETPRGSEELVLERNFRYPSPSYMLIICIYGICGCFVAVARLIKPSQALSRTVRCYEALGLLASDYVVRG